MATYYTNPVFEDDIEPSTSQMAGEPECEEFALRPFNYLEGDMPEPEVRVSSSPCPVAMARARRHRGSVASKKWLATTLGVLLLLLLVVVIVGVVVTVLNKVKDDAQQETSTISGLEGNFTVTPSTPK